MLVLKILAFGWVLHSFGFNLFVLCSSFAYRSVVLHNPNINGKQLHLMILCLYVPSFILLVSWWRFDFRIPHDSTCSAFRVPPSTFGLIQVVPPLDFPLAPNSSCSSFRLPPSAFRLPLNSGCSAFWVLHSVNYKLFRFTSFAFRRVIVVPPFEFCFSRSVFQVQVVPPFDFRISQNSSCSTFRLWSPVKLKLFRPLTLVFVEFKLRSVTYAAVFRKTENHIHLPASVFRKPVKYSIFSNEEQFRTSGGTKLRALSTDHYEVVNDVMFRSSSVSTKEIHGF